MAPQSRKRKSDAMEETPHPHTPTGSPARKRMKITESQKQALIDNLQLESMSDLELALSLANNTLSYGKGEKASSTLRATMR